jgi:hypothetical protein
LVPVARPTREGVILTGRPERDATARKGLCDKASRASLRKAALQRLQGWTRRIIKHRTREWLEIPGRECCLDSVSHGDRGDKRKNLR